MKIAIMGSGGIGGYFGGCLAADNDVTFIARGAHLAAMREHGLSLSGPRGDKLIDATSATDNPSGIGVVDLVLFCVKLYDTESAGELIASLMGDHSRVLSLQNGVDGPERLANMFGAERVLGGSAYVSAHIAAPGQIKYMSEMSRMVFGTLDNKLDSAAEAILAACDGADFDAELSDNVSRILWSKMVMLAANAGVSSMMRQPVRAVYDNPQSRQVAIDAMAEVAAVARARGVDLPDDLIAGLVATSEKFPPDMRASMCHDLLAERRIEIDGLSGLIARLGDELDVPVPINRAIAVALGPFKDGSAS